MTSQEPAMTRMHYRLFMVGTWARILSWPVLFFLLLSSVTTYHQQVIQIVQTFNKELSLGELFSADPVLGMNLILKVGLTILTGVVYWLVLQGVALGLDMIVETDLNYRERAHAQP